MDCHPASGDDSHRQFYPVGGCLVDLAIGSIDARKLIGIILIVTDTDLKNRFMKNGTLWATSAGILLLLAAGFLLPSTASNITVQIAEQTNCKNAKTTADLNVCSSQELQAADTKLNQLYQQLLPKISSQQKQRLNKAQLTWVKFRDETCDYTAGQFDGGSAATFVYNSCLAEVTKNRVKDLEGYLEQASL
jgi:uncharacterized protein YecT (DUF1311 family)